MKHNNKIRPRSGLFFGWTAALLSVALLSAFLLSGCRTASGEQSFESETAPVESGRNRGKAQSEEEKGGWTDRAAETGSSGAAGQDDTGTETEKTNQPGRWDGMDGIRVYLEKTEFPADTVSISYTRENRTENRLRYVSGGSLEQLSDGIWKTRMTEPQEAALCTMEEYSKRKENFRLDGLTEPLEEGSYRIRLNGMDIIPPLGSEGAFGENMAGGEILLEFTIGEEGSGRLPAFGTGGTSHTAGTDESWVWRSTGQAWQWGKEEGFRVVNLRQMADGLTLLQYEAIPAKEKPAQLERPGTGGIGADELDLNADESVGDENQAEESPEKSWYKYGMFDRKDGAFYPVPDMVCEVSWDQVITDGTASAWFVRTDGTAVRADLKSGQVILREYEELPGSVPEVNGITEVLDGKLVIEADPFSYAAGTKKVTLWVSNCSTLDIEISGGLFDGLGLWYYDSYVPCVSELWEEEPDFIIRAGERVRTSFSIEGLHEPVEFREAADVIGRYRLTAGNKRIRLTDPENDKEQVEQAAYGVEFRIVEQGMEETRDGGRTDDRAEMDGSEVSGGQEDSSEKDRNEEDSGMREGSGMREDSGRGEEAGTERTEVRQEELPGEE